MAKFGVDPRATDGKRITFARTMKAQKCWSSLPAFARNRIWDTRAAQMTRFSPSAVIAIQWRSLCKLIAVLHRDRLPTAKELREAAGLRSMTRPQHLSTSRGHHVRKQSDVGLANCVCDLVRLGAIVPVGKKSLQDNPGYLLTELGWHLANVGRRGRRFMIRYRPRSRATIDAWLTRLRKAVQSYKVWLYDLQ